MIECTMSMSQRFDGRPPMSRQPSRSGVLGQMDSLAGRQRDNAVTHANERRPRRRATRRAYVRSHCARQRHSLRGPESERETLFAEQLRKTPAGDVGVGGRAYDLVQSPQHAVWLVSDVDRRDLHCRVPARLTIASASVPASEIPYATCRAKRSRNTNRSVPRTTLAKVRPWMTLAYARAKSSFSASVKSRRDGCRIE